MNQRPRRGPVEPGLPPQMPPAQGPVGQAPAPRRRPWYARVWRFVRLVNRRFETGPISAGIALLILLLAFMCANPLSRVAFRMFKGR